MSQRLLMPSPVLYGVPRTARELPVLAEVAACASRGWLEAARGQDDRLAPSVSLPAGVRTTTPVTGPRSSVDQALRLRLEATSTPALAAEAYSMVDEPGPPPTASQHEAAQKRTCRRPCRPAGRTSIQRCRRSFIQRTVACDSRHELVRMSGSAHSSVDAHEVVVKLSSV